MQLFVTFASFLALATVGYGQTPTKVTAFKDGPTNLGMYVYVPKKLTTPAPIIVAIHHCQGSATGYASETKYQPLADSHGFILIYPNSRSSGGCFDVSSTACKCTCLLVRPAIMFSFDEGSVLIQLLIYSPDPRWWRRQPNHREHGQIRSGQLRRRCEQDICDWD
jgi:hypothetical protein